MIIYMCIIILHTISANTRDLKYIDNIKKYLQKLQCDIYNKNTIRKNSPRIEIKFIIMLLELH